MSQSSEESDRAHEEVWAALRAIRQALEARLPPGWMRPSAEIPSSVSAEINAVIAAIDAMADAIPPERLTERVV